MVILTEKFFEKPTLTVARKLLGKVLVRRHGGRELGALITEVEAYDGVNDLASHASRGLTPRTKVMFGTPGTWYVYLTYGMHWMLNVVTREKGYPAAVLIRGTDAVSGPGRVTKKLKITGKLNSLPAKRASGLWIEDRGIRVPIGRIKKSPRVGIDYAGPVWSRKNWRLFIRSGDAFYKRGLAQNKNQAGKNHGSRGGKFKKTQAR